MLSTITTASPKPAGLATAPDIRSSHSRHDTWSVPAFIAVVVACVCAGIGLFAVSSSVAALLTLWHSDDLRSMGLVVPFVSFALVLRSWKQIGWRADGSWWGLALFAFVAALVFLQNEMFLTVTVNHAWLPQIPPLPLVAVLYAASLVLLFGGIRLLRAGWFGVLFMVMVIPVPHLFSSLVDLHLQHASAVVARGFAHALGQKLTEDKLRLMFTPDFGMFIAPGCNGIRGAITLGLAAVVVSYLYRFRWFVYAPVVMGAVLLGYLFNFLRLCLLVVYYKIALPYPWLQQRATGADFLIGGALFVCALGVFFSVVNRLRNDPADVRPPAMAAEPAYPGRAAGLPLLWRSAAMLALTLVFGWDAYVARRAEAQVLTSPRNASMPSQLGNYRLGRTWNDANPDGSIVYSWGEYAAPDGGPHVALGISPDFDLHDVEICHMARGETPIYRGELNATSAGKNVDLTIDTYNNGTRQWLEASTVCFGDACHEFTETTRHVSVVYAPTRQGLPLANHGAVRPVPVLLRVDTLDTNSPEPTARAVLLGRLQNFLSAVSLPEVTRPYATRSH